MRMYVHTWKNERTIYFFCFAFDIDDPGIHSIDWSKSKNESAIGIVLMLRAYIQIKQSHVYFPIVQ